MVNETLNCFFLLKSSIYLSCIWSSLSEDIIVDSDSFSDLNPQQSNNWSITINNNCDKCDYQLTSLLSKFVDESKRTISVGQLLGSSMQSASANELAASSSSSNLNEELKQTSLNKLSSARSTSKQLDRVYNMSSNMMEKATNRMKTINSNETLPLSKTLLDLLMDVGNPF